MAKHNELGTQGEEYACDYLKQKGYLIRARNFRYKHLEIDIIAEKDDCLIIVEVKTRNSGYLTDPTEILSKRKQQNLVKCAAEYLEQQDWDGDTQFDLIILIENSKKRQVNHIQDAFYPM